MSDPAPQRFGRYEIVSELGRGAMGVVYKARDPQIDRFVAVKTISLWGQDPDAEKEFRMRFMNEAQAAGRLHHAGIVSIFDLGESPENRDPYIVLEFVAGEALSRILSREKKLPVQKALKLAEEVADALEYAHAQGVIHRDIKPGNILVTADGHPKIADFGIAKLNLAHFTLPGRVLGTPAYMAPEQLSGEGVDARSDLFSLGVILYAMTTGHSPFQGDSATTVCFKVANREPVAASALDLTLPAELDAVIAKAMAKVPAERYQRGSEFADDLRQLQTMFKPGSTTTSLRPLTATSRPPTHSTTAARLATDAPAVSVEHAEKVVRRAIRKVSVRDLILIAAALTLLVVVGAQWKLLKTTPRTATLTSQTTLPPAPGSDTLRPAGNAPQAQPAIAQPAPAASPKPAPAHARVPRKVHPQAVKAEQAPAPPQSFSTLDLAVQHQFVDATLYVWIDDTLALTRPLHGGSQKHLVVFNGVHGVDSETLKVPSGKHSLRFRAVSADRTVDLSRTISADFIQDDNRSLHIVFDKHNTEMKISWQ
jgi:eukaryotic-like serine/threonine-protein kinase